MRALVVQHDHVSPPGPVGERLVDRGYDLDLHTVVEQDNFHTPHVHNPFPTLEGVDLVVTMGAVWSAYDVTTIGSWVGTELDLLREADRTGVPVLGICFGGQLLAAAHGGRVERSDEPEIGWVTVQSEDDVLAPPGPWFQWHFDRWVTPPGAVELARNAVAPQAFALRRNLAVQFHPELTPAMLDGWLGNGGAESATAHGRDPDGLRRETAVEGPAAARRAKALVDAFLDLVATVPPAPGRSGTMATERPQRYARQLARHWSDKATTWEAGEETVICFDGGSTVRMVPAAGELVIRVEVPSGEGVAGFADVVARHLVRFGRRHELEVVWGPAETS